MSLYSSIRKQRDLMSNIGDKVVQKYLIQAGTSQLNLLSSRIQFEDDEQRWPKSDVPLVDSHYARQSKLGINNILSHYNSANGKIRQPSCVPNQSGEDLEEETLELSRKKVCRKLFDLELPANEYIDFEAEKKKSFNVSGEKCYPSNRKNESIHERNGKFSIHIGTKSGCDGDSSSSNLYLRRNHGFMDLNEPTDQVGETSGPASVTSSERKIQAQVLSGKAHSGICYLAKASSQTAENERGQGVCYQRMDNEKNQGWFLTTLQAGETRNGRSSCTGNKCPQGFTVCESTQAEKKNSPTMLLSGRSKTQEHIKRKLFGVEISEINQDASFDHSEIVDLQIPCVPKCDAAKSESSFISSSMKPPKILSRNCLPIQASPHFTMSPQLNKSSMTTVESPAVIKDCLIKSATTRPITSLRAEASYENDFCLGSQSDSNELQHPSISLRSPNGVSEINSHSEQLKQRGPRKEFWGLGCIVDGKSLKDLNINALPPNKHQNEMILSDNLVSEGEERNPQEIFPLFKVRPHSDGKSSEEREGINLMYLDSSHNLSQQLINNIESRKDPTEIQDCSSATQPHDIEHDMIEADDSSSNRKILGFSSYEKPHFLEDPTPNSPLKSTCLASSNKIDISVTYEFGKSNLAYGPISEEQRKEDGVLGSRSLNHNGESWLLIDLNTCVTEEETQLTPNAPIVKIATKIDLEAPILVEKKIDISSGGEFLESNHQESVNSLDDAFSTHEELAKFAAEALVSISSSSLHTFHDNATNHQAEAPTRDSLYWLAELISSHRGDIENDYVDILVGKDSIVHEEFTPDGVDYFEFATLNLTETKVEECFYESQVLENPKDFQTLPKRHCKGQTRRGRQRKDFQRGVLPSLTSLSRREVNEDLQTIEGLIKGAGGSWQSSLANKFSAKSSGRRGRRLSGVSAPSPTPTAVCPLQIKQPNCGETGIGERSLTGWGKRTRRPPRQRYLINNPSVTPK
ncbi:DUF863 domain-containing protein [Quillaja saponaria]|uniref:DUF863 domain-containing protein n=1 Tax=Quillaja saponaria TaxID=32244 RepID=A0AAD7PXJ8_QUISA|nr:DUF863 domain-containing protein [Quillaja saponaria]